MILGRVKVACPMCGEEVEFRVRLACIELDAMNGSWGVVYFPERTPVEPHPCRPERGGATPVPAPGVGSSGAGSPSDGVRVSGSGRRSIL